MPWYTAILQGVCCQFAMCTDHLQEISTDLKAAQHARQAAEDELLHLKQKAAEVAGKLEITGAVHGRTVAEYDSKHARSCIALQALQPTGNLGSQSKSQPL